MIGYLFLPHGLLLHGRILALCVPFMDLCYQFAKFIKTPQVLSFIQVGLAEIDEQLFNNTEDEKIFITAGTDQILLTKI